MKRLDEEGIRDFLNRHEIEIGSESESKEGKVLFLKNGCVFDSSHADSGKILISAKGTVAYKCNHESCSDKRLSDFIKLYEPDFYKDQSGISTTRKKSNPREILDAVKNMATIEEREIEWLIPGYMPRQQVTILAADGGSGKGGIAVSFVAAVTSGTIPEILDLGVPFEAEPEKVLYLTTEDPAAEVLRKRFRVAGADLSQIDFIGMDHPLLKEINFTDENEYIRTLLEAFRPGLVVFDPLQAFIPENVKMGERNHMRKCMSKLPVYGGEFGTTFLVLCHTNKRDGASGRNRIADSADIWDIARSVMIAGFTGEDDIRYLSHEKSNYGKLQKTILFTVNDEGKACFNGTTEKKDRDFQKDKQSSTRAAPSKDGAKQHIIDALKAAAGHTLAASELDKMCEAMSISKATLRRAKDDLKSEGMIKYTNKGYGKEKVWFVELVQEKL